MNNARKLAYIAVLSSVAVVLGWLEQMIPMPVAVPGIKLGLSNIAVLVAMDLLGRKSAFAVTIFKALVCGVLFWGVGGMIYGLCGSIFAFIAMAIFINKKFLGIVGISVIGAVFHNIGQLVALFIMSGSFSFVYYICVLGIAAVITGSVTGIVARLVLSKLEKPKNDSPVDDMLLR